MFFGLRTNSSLSSQSPRLFFSMAKSSMVASPEPSKSVTLRPRISAMARTSWPRCEKRRRSIKPLVISWPGAIAVTRVTGRKTLLRPEISITKPVARGGKVLRYAIRTSMTFPTRSPSGSKTPQPANRATKTLVALTEITLFCKSKLLAKCFHD